MKLFHCPICLDIQRLTLTRRFCECKRSSAYVKPDRNNAVFGGLAIPIGIGNYSFRTAVEERPESGMGKEFLAFVIPKQCDTIEHENGVPEKPLKTQINAV